MRRTRAAMPYLPAIDGVRALAVVAVLLYHSGFRWARGGHLGVTMFFTLSGFLIMSLLLGERERTGTVDLRAFWGRRVRRLVPGALVCVALVAVFVAASGTTVPSSTLGDGIASSTWVANWRFIFVGHAYGDLFSGPSPFLHFWSLAIEEQFYLVLPLLTVGLLCGARHRRGRKVAFTALIAAGAVASTIVAARLHHPDGPALRAYFGTDARAAEPLIGVLLALFMFRGQLRTFGRRAAVAIDVASVGALVGLGVLMTQLGERSNGLYEGGFALAALLTAVLVVAATQRTTVARLLAVRPLVAVGRVSYGVYLFHWPIFLWISQRSTGLPTVPLLVARLAATFALTAASYHLLESPIRAGRLRPSIGLVGWANATTGLAAALAIAVGTATAAPATVLLTGPSAFAAPPPPPPPPVPSSPVTTSASTPVISSAAAAPVPSAPGRPASRPTSPTTAKPVPRNDPIVNGGGAEAAPPQAPPPAPVATQLRVAVIGDSMALGLGGGLNEWAESRDDVVVYNLGWPACPLGRGGDERYPRYDPFSVDQCTWWDDPSSERSTKLRAFDADVIVVQDGFMEMLDRRVPGWSDFKNAGDPVFDKWLLDEYRSMVQAVASNGARMLFLNAVCADWSQHDQWSDISTRPRQLNTDVYLPLSSVVKVGDLQQELCPDGSFRNELYGVEDARPDGYHLSSEAARALAERWLGPMLLGMRP